MVAIGIVGTKMKLIVKRHRVAYKQLQRDWIEWMKSKGVENPVLVRTRGDSTASLLLTYVMGSRLYSLYHGISHFQDARHRTCAYSLNRSLFYSSSAHLSSLQRYSLSRLAHARRLGVRSLQSESGSLTIVNRCVQHIVASACGRHDLLCTRANALTRPLRFSI